MKKKVPVKKEYKMRCKCNYTYYYVGVQYYYEICPICGHGAPFDEFKTQEKEIEEDYNQ